MQDFELYWYITLSTDFCSSQEHSSLTEKEMSEIIEEHILKRSEPNPNGF